MSFIQDITSKATSSIISGSSGITSKVDPRQIQSQLKGAGYVKNRAGAVMSEATMEYPLEQNGDTDDYVLFFINEYDYPGTRTSKTMTDSASPVRSSSSTGNSVALGQILNNVSNAKLGATAATKDKEGSAGTSLLDVLGMTDKNGAKISFNPPRKRSSEVIALYMTHSLQTNYGMQYGEVNADGVLGAMLDNYSKTGNIKEAGQVGFDAFKSEFSKSLGGVVANIVDSGRGGTGSAHWKDHLTKTVRNPRKETSFVGVAFRQFQFSFLLTPSNETETKMINDILRTFKKHMHPELSGKGDGNMNLRFPNDFDIEFRHGMQENTKINKILTCVLENMSVSYTPNNMWSTHVDGQPTAIMLTLQFREVEPLNRGHIMEGF